MKRTLRKQTKKHRRSNRLRIQPLEKRQLMAADIGLVDGFVSINGTQQNDVAEIYSESGSIFVKVSTFAANGDEIASASDTFQESEVEGILFQSGEGDDLFVNDTNIDSITRTGGGHDTVMGGGGNDILAVGSGNDVVFGGGGDDIILAGPGTDVVIPPAESTAADPDAELPGAELPGAELPGAELPGAELPADEDPVATDGDDETPVESELVDETSDVTIETSQEDVTGEDESPTEIESTEDTMIENDTETLVGDPELTDDGGIAVEDNVDDEAGGDEDFVCHAHDQAESEDADDTVVETDPEASALVSPDQVSAPDASVVDTPGDEVVVPEDLDPTDTAGNVEPIGLAIALSDEDEEELGDSEVIDPAVDLSDDAAGSDNAAGPEETDNDVIFGGSGDDWIFGETGSDLIFGGASAVDDALLRMVIAGRLSA